MSDIDEDEQPTFLYDLSLNEYEIYDKVGDGEGNTAWVYRSGSGYRLAKYLLTIDQLADFVSIPHILTDFSDARVSRNTYEQIVASWGEVPIGLIVGFDTGTRYWILRIDGEIEIFRGQDDVKPVRLVQDES